MAYIRCSDDKCEFSQDDFWTLRFRPQWKFWYWRSVFGYNPITCLLEGINSYWRPRWIGFDESFIRDIEKGHNFHFIIRVIEKESPIQWGEPWVNQEEHYGEIRKWKQFQIFSWSMLKWEFYRAYLKFKEMKWWTEREYKNDLTKTCPKCGKYISSSMID